jgi:beta-phosphoglucomutase
MTKPYLFEACIFDFDGVIVDTAGFHYLSWKKLANQLGFEFTQEQNEAMKGISRMDSLDVVLEIGNITVSHDEKIELAKQKNDWYREYLNDIDESAILPGVLHFLKELSEANIPFALGSASKNAGYIIPKLGIVPLFHTILDGNDTSRSKPDPEIFVMGADAMQKKPESIVVFEDSYKGLVAAQTAGFISCGVGNTEILHNADFVIASFEEFSIEKLNVRIGEMKTQ